MRRSFITLKLYYFGWYGALGVLLPFLPLWYREIGLNESQIGLVSSIPALIGLFAAPAWAALADTFRLQRVLLPIGIAGAVLLTTLIGATRSFLPVLALASAQAFVTAPVGALAESGVLAVLGDQRARYGEQRMWGSVAWAFAALAGGWLFAQWGAASAFIAFFAIGAFTVLVATRLPPGTPDKGNLRAGALKLLRDPHLAAFLAGSFLIGCAGAALMGFRALFYQDLGLGSQFVGLADAVAAATEIPFMFFSPLLLRKVAPVRLMVVAPAAYVFVGLIQIASPLPTLLLFAALLRGIAFALFWTGGVLAAQSFAPAGLSATTQSLFITATMTLSALVAYPIAGWVYQTSGFIALFAGGTALAIVGGLVLGLVTRRRVIAVG